MQKVFLRIGEAGTIVPAPPSRDLIFKNASIYTAPTESTDQSGSPR